MKEVLCHIICWIYNDSRRRRDPDNTMLPSYTKKHHWSGDEREWDYSSPPFHGKLMTREEAESLLVKLKERYPLFAKKMHIEGTAYTRTEKGVSFQGVIPIKVEK
jgi:hypothetical protein